jgi:hypothetical protein
MKREVQASLRGRVRVKVLRDGKELFAYPWQENLILDSGLDKVATVAFNQLFSNCAVGTGTQVTNIRPSATATVAGNVLSASAATFSSADLDSDVRFDSGEYFKIQSVTDPQHVTLFSSGTVATATLFTILRTNQTILGSESKRTNDCSQVPNANQTLDLGGSLLLQRTFLFDPETTNSTYTEVGFSNITTPGANLFSRVLLATPVHVNGPAGELTGQQLQVTYQLTIGFDYGQGPGVLFAGSTPTTIAIAGLPIATPIVAYANSLQIPGKLQVTVAPPVPLAIGDSATLAGSSVPAYNGNWPVLLVVSDNAPPTGPVSIVTLDVPFTTVATANVGTLAPVETGTFFRPRRGIYQVNSVGGQSPPPVTPDVFFGFGEPSIAGEAWVSKDDASALGSNGVAVAPRTPQIANCLLQPYTPGSFYIDKKAVFTIADNDPISSFGVGNPDTTNQIETWTWDSPQALGAGSLIEFIFRFSWNRTTF